MSLLSERAMLVRPSISIWDGEVVDRRASDGTAERFNAAKAAVTTTKRLISKEAIDPIKKEGAALRAYVRAETLPWRWDGVGLLPSDNYFDFMEGWRSHHEQFDAAVNALLRRWNVHVGMGQRALGELANEYDYPTSSEVADKFKATVEVFPVPDAADFRAEIGADQAEEIRLKLQAAADQELLNAQSYMWEQTQELVQRVVTRLGDYKTGFNKDGKEIVVAGRIHDSLIDNLKVHLNRLGRLNITKDPAIEAMRQKAMAEITDDFTSQDLRDSEENRKVVKKSAEGLLDLMRAGGFLPTANAAE